ncbi:MAG: FGGY-family carbohydrate kinase, partial [Pseudomonadota bacterium]
IVGQITPQAAAETGLASGTPVTAGGIDAAAEAVSVGVRKPGDLMLMYGSTVFVIRVGAAERRDPRLWHAPWLFPGEGAAMAGLATSGTLTHWFRERFAADLDPQTAFATLAEEAAASPPGANGLLLLPYFSGERTPIHDPDARGVLFGLDLTHSRGDVYRAFIEGIAYGTAHVTETYAETGLPAQRIRAVGGGVKNPLWLQATSDATGLAQEVCARTTGAAYGDAFIAALAVGAASPEDVDRWNPVARVIEPVEDPALARRYDQWKRLYLATQPLMSELAEERRT